VNIKSITLLLFISANLYFGSASATPLVIEITKSIADATPIAVVPFSFEGKQKLGKKNDISAIIDADLARTGKFKSLRKQDMLSKPHDGASVKFTNWRLLGVEHLIVGNIKETSAGRFSVSFWLFDVFKGSQMLAFSIPGSRKNIRDAAHTISDIIYKELTGEEGAFRTKIAYVTASGFGDERRYSLWLADADGERPQRLMKSPQPIMSPSWSPDGRKIAYASLEKGGRQRIYIQHWRSGKRQKLKLSVPGLYGAPAWSPDGKSLALAISHLGNAEIYVYNLANKRLKKVTKHYAIDTEPTWTPDGKSIIFTSDRGGRPQLYKIASDGGRVERITFGGQENARARVSPDGKSLVMVHMESGKYRIAVMELGSGNLTVLTDGGLDESPSFAPNGSMIIYATTTGNKGVLAAVSFDGRVRQALSAREDEDIREPAWSPFNNK
jgi:TolB protein